jgi:hypothetical protein
MTVASNFWLDTIYDSNLNQSLSLPFDGYPLQNELRTGHGISVSFDFGEDLSYHFLTYASSKHVAPIYVALASYYTLLFKLTNRDNDLCIGMNIHNRGKE